MLVVDVSASEEFGSQSRSKAEVIAEGLPRRSPFPRSRITTGSAWCCLPIESRR